MRSRQREGRIFIRRKLFWGPLQDGENDKLNKRVPARAVGGSAVQRRGAKTSLLFSLLGVLPERGVKSPLLVASESEPRSAKI